jgi:hypothetical protein
MLTLGFVKVTHGYVKKGRTETLPFLIRHNTLPAVKAILLQAEYNIRRYLQVLQMFVPHSLQQ